MADITFDVEHGPLLVAMLDARTVRDKAAVLPGGVLLPTQRICRWYLDSHTQCLYPRRTFPVHWCHMWPQLVHRPAPPPGVAVYYLCLEHFGACAQLQIGPLTFTQLHTSALCAFETYRRRV